MGVGRIMALIGTTLSLMTGPIMASAGLSSQPAEHSTLQRISVQVEGSGKDVILIPGLASSRKVWDDLVPKLRQSYRLHLVELAGFAGSPAVPETKGKVIAPAVEEIADYIHSQRIKAPVIIGHSLGGEAALMLGARHPDQVGRLLIVDALPFYSLLVDPSATTETATAPAAVMRDSLMAASAEQNEAMQTASIARLVKNEAYRPGLVADSIRSDRTRWRGTGRVPTRPRKSFGILSRSDWLRFMKRTKKWLKQWPATQAQKASSFGLSAKMASCLSRRTFPSRMSSVIPV